MKPSARVLLAMLLLAAAGLGIYVLCERSRQAAQQRIWTSKREEARAALALVHAPQDRALTASELSVNARPREAGGAAGAESSDASSAQLLAAPWRQSAAALRTLLARHPHWAIPEIDQLSADEFIFFARDAQLDTAESQRKTLRDLRALAKRKVAARLHEALHEYATEHGNRLPTDVRELARHLNPPLPESVLLRYALTDFSLGASGSGGEWVLYERAPVDELYDTRHVLGVRMSAQLETDPAVYVLARALVAYADANSGGQPLQLAELASYLEVPLEPSTLARYFRNWQEQPATLALRSRFRGITTNFLPIGAPRPPGNGAQEAAR